MASRESSPRDAAYWYVPLARAIPAAALAAVITFSQDHSPRLGLLSFGGFAVLSGIALGVLAARLMIRSVERSLFITQGGITLLAGVAALLAPGGGLGYVLFLVPGLILHICCIVNAAAVPSPLPALALTERSSAL